MMNVPLYAEARALKDCRPVAVHLYLRGLLRMLDAADGRVRGPRRLMLSWIVTEVGPVQQPGGLPRPLQHQEVASLLRELVRAGAVINDSDAAEINLLMVHRAPKDMA